MQLPPSISSWSGVLQIFPNDIAQELRLLSRRLSPLLGPLPQAELHGNDEVDGIGGLTNKINYERLLISEWAVANTSPQEFLRRATAGEHLFLELARYQPHSKKSVVVLLNSGPDQLGKPRLLHMALLILLGRRAEQIKADFFWGVFQDDSCKLHSEINESSIITLLHSNSSLSHSPKQMEGWQQRLSTELMAECWCIGVPRIQETFQAQHTVSITEPLKADVRTLEVTVDDGQRQRSAEVTLPDDDIGVRILRSPFEQKRANIAPVDHGCGNITIGHHGRKMAYKIANTVYVYTIPSSQNAKVGQVRQFTFPEGHSLVAINLTKKRISAITQDNGHWYYHRFPNAHRVITQTKSQRLSVQETGAMPTFLFDKGPRQDRLLLLDANQRIRSLDLPPETNLYQAIAQKVIAFGDCGIGPYYIYQLADDEVEMVWMTSLPQPSTARFGIALKRPPGAFVHSSGNWSKNSIGALAIEYAEGLWQLYSQKKEVEITVKPNESPCGVICYQLDNRPENLARNRRLHLIVHNEDENAIYSINQHNERRIVLDCDGGISGLQLNPRYPYLHYKEESGDDITYCIDRGVELLRLSQEKLA